MSRKEGGNVAAESEWHSVRPAEIPRFVAVIRLVLGGISVRRLLVFFLGPSTPGNDRFAPPTHVSVEMQAKFVI